MNDERDPRLDPDQRYSACGLRSVDRSALRILSLLPQATVQRTRDCYQFTVTDPDGLVVLLTPDAVELRLPTVEWTGGYMGPVACSTLWKRRRSSHLTDKTLSKLIEAGFVARRQQIRPCAYCGRPTPPEHGHTVDEKWVCHGCSEQHLGVVH